MSTTTPTNSTTSPAPPPLPTLKRGGRHPIFGIYVRGSALNQEYKLTCAQSYSSTSKLRTEKSINMAETSFHSQQGNITSLKFNGKLDVTKGDNDSLTKLNLEVFYEVWEIWLSALALKHSFISQTQLER